MVNGFFTDMQATDGAPVTVMVPAPTHPDTALRRLGIIAQEGRSGWWRFGKRLRYDANTDQWTHVKTGNAVAVTSEKVKGRVDQVRA